MPIALWLLGILFYIALSAGSGMTFIMLFFSVRLQVVFIVITEMRRCEGYNHCSRMFSYDTGGRIHGLPYHKRPGDNQTIHILQSA